MLLLKAREVRSIVDVTGEPKPVESDAQIEKAGRRKKRLPKMTREKAIERAVALTMKQTYRSRNSLASEIPCSPNNDGLKTFWSRYLLTRGKITNPLAVIAVASIQADPLAKLVEQEDLARLIREQEAELKAEGKPRRSSV